MIFVFRLRWAPLLMASLLIGGCQKAPAPPAPVRPPASVTAAPAAAKDVPVYLDEIGKCAAPETVSIQPQVSGRITGLYFKEGTELKKGDRLFTIDPRPFQAQLEQVKAELELNKAQLEQSEATTLQQKAMHDQMQAELAQSKSRQELNLIELERAKNLLETKAVARQEFDSKQMATNVGVGQISASTAAVAVADAQVRQSGAAVAMAKAKITASQAAITSAEINLGYTEIVSPIDGRAGQKLVDLGNIVNAAISAPLLVIQRLDPIYVDFTVPERELGAVRKAMAAGDLKVECRTPEEPEKPRIGEIFFLDNAVQEGTGTIKLRASIPNGERFLWPGQFVNVRLLLGIHKNATLIPALATQIGQAGPFVYIVKADGTADLRLVKPGQRHGDLIVIDEGIKPGENVILTGQMMVFPGAPVAVKDETQKATVKGEAPK